MSKRITYVLGLMLLLGLPAMVGCSPSTGDSGSPEEGDQLSDLRIVAGDLDAYSPADPFVIDLDAGPWRIEIDQTDAPVELERIAFQRQDGGLLPLSTWAEEFEAQTGIDLSAQSMFTIVVGRGETPLHRRCDSATARADGRQREQTDDPKYYKDRPEDEISAFLIERGGTVYVPVLVPVD